MREQHLSGIDYLNAVTALLQRVRAAHPTAVGYEAADFQWWWRTPRSTDHHPQLFWFDDAGEPVAARAATDWGEATGLTPILMPGATPEMTARIVERGLRHADDSNLQGIEVGVDPADQALVDALAADGYTEARDELVDSWLAADDRPPVSDLDRDYRLATRLDTASSPHHMVARNGAAVEERLRQTSLYRADLDLVVLGPDDAPAAYGLFWFDPVTASGLVEPMRTEDEHQGRGLGRHVITAGIDRLAALGAARVKIAWDTGNEPAHHLYTSVGFAPERQFVLVTRPAEEPGPSAPAD